jgi:hypothetical protein
VITQFGNRRVDAFFYGLFMDEAVLRKSGVTPTNPRRAYVTDFALRIGQRATLVPSKGAKAFGMLMSLTHADLDILYGSPDLEHYKPEAVVAQTLEGLSLPALCFNLPEAPNPGERNLEYTARLQSVLNQLGFPREYVESLL